MAADRFVETLGDVKYPVLTNGGLSHLADVREVRVPHGELYVLGDNRDHSGDSREAMLIGRGLGFIPESDVVGRVESIWLSLPPCGEPSFDRSGPVTPCPGPVGMLVHDEPVPTTVHGRRRRVPGGMRGWPGSP